jgi:hypothetical protein
VRSRVVEERDYAEIAPRPTARRRRCASACREAWRRCAADCPRDHDGGRR